MCDDARDWGDNAPSETPQGTLCLISPCDSPSYARNDLPATKSGVLDLRILATSDLHGHLRGYDYAQDTPVADLGLSRISALVRQARAEMGNTMLFDNGDFLQGTPLVDQWAHMGQGRPADETHPMIAAMNAMGYDAVTPGNHEFNFGLPFLLASLRDAGFPVVCANMLRSGPVVPANPPLFPPWRVLHRDFPDRAGVPRRIGIGVIGFLPPQTAVWDRGKLAGEVITRDIVETARAEVPRLRAAGADLVIALAHTGIEAFDPAGSGAPGPAENAALALAAVEGVDVLICGHSHMQFPAPAQPCPLATVDPVNGRLWGKPAVMPGRWGSHLGVIDLRLTQGAGGRWRITGASSTLRATGCRLSPRRVVALAEEDPQILALSAPAHERVQTTMAQPVTRLIAPLHSFFAMAAPDAVLTLIATIKAACIRARLADRPEGRLPVLASVSPTKSGGRGGPQNFVDIPAGLLTQRHVASLYTYPNVISAVEVTGAQLADWLERAAGAFARLIPGETGQALLDPAFPGYNFDVIHGLTYQIDPTIPARYSPDGSLRDGAAQRIHDLRHAGAPVRAHDRFIVATNSFRSSGAGLYNGLFGPAIPLGPDLSSQDMLLTALRDLETCQPRAEAVWRFAQMPGTTAYFDTAQAARGHLHGLPLTEVGTTGDGFLRLSLAL